MNHHVGWMVTLQISEGRLGELLALTSEMVQSASREPGCLVFERYLSGEDDHRLQIYERYRDCEAAVQHLQAFFRDYADRFSPLVQRIEFRVFGAADPELREVLDQFHPEYFRLADGIARI